MKPIEHTLLPPCQATDVTQFFIDITEAYLVFEQSVVHLLHALPGYTSKQIVNECNMLERQRDQLAILDEQMFAIIDLAGAEIARTPMVHDYRVAFARASMACNNLYQKLQALKTTLQNESTAMVGRSFT